LAEIHGVQNIQFKGHGGGIMPLDLKRKFDQLCGREVHGDPTSSEEKKPMPMAKMAASLHQLVEDYNLQVQPVRDKAIERNKSLVHYLDTETDASDSSRRSLLNKRALQVPRLLDVSDMTRAARKFKTEMGWQPRAYNGKGKMLATDDHRIVTFRARREAAIAKECVNPKLVLWFDEVLNPPPKAGETSAAAAAATVAAVTSVISTE
jgi:ribosomal protein L24E